MFPKKEIFPGITTTNVCPLKQWILELNLHVQREVFSYTLMFSEVFMSCQTVITNFHAVKILTEDLHFCMVDEVLSCCLFTCYWVVVAFILLYFVKIQKILKDHMFIRDSPFVRTSVVIYYSGFVFDAFVWLIGFVFLKLLIAFSLKSFNLYSVRFFCFVFA